MAEPTQPLPPPSGSSAASSAPPLPAEWRAPRALVRAAGGFAAFLFALVVMIDYGIAMPLFYSLRGIPGGDKTLHFVLMGAMALLANIVFRGRRIEFGPFIALRGSLLVAVVVTLEEFSQRWLVRRNFDYEDLAYDYLGIICLGQLGAAAARWMEWRHARRSRRGGAR